jgi:nucleoid-associated protein YgaU
LIVDVLWESVALRIEAKQMAVNPLKALLFLAAGCTVAAATAYVSDVFAPFDEDQPPAALLPDAPSFGAEAKAARLSGHDGAVKEQPADAFAAKTVLPSFDLVSVQGDGSIVIAGRAAPNARVEAGTETRNIGATTAGSNGDFAIVIDEPLDPGDYQILLRQIIADNIQLSREAAIISIPETEDGQVLVLVEMAGEASRLVAVPNASSGDLSALTLARGPATAPPPTPQHGSSVSVEAVEIEGSSMFVAGAAAPGRRVQAYIDNVLIGDAVASPAGRFLIETERALASGDHTIRVDALGADGAEVLARAAVPFANEGGDAFADAAPTIFGTVASAPSGGQATETAPAAEATGAQAGKVNRAVIIRRGDTLWQISRRIYGQGVRFSAIYFANQNQIKDPNRIWPGQVFRVPEKTPEGDPADLEAVGKQATTTATQ